MKFINFLLPLPILLSGCSFQEEKAMELSQLDSRLARIESDYGTTWYTKIPAPQEINKKNVTDILRDAAKGDLKNQRAAALLYRDGFRVKRNLVKACEWLEKAAKAGDAESQLILAYMFSGNYNRPVDEKVTKWGYKGFIGETPIEVNCIDTDFKKAWYWYQKAAGNGNAEAFYSLGLMYEEGRFLLLNRSRGECDIELAEKVESPLIEKDLKKAVECYRKAANLGFMKAKIRLANMYLLGLGVKQDIEQARKIYKEALNTKQIGISSKDSWSWEESKAYRYSIFNRSEIEKLLKILEKK